ncbi:hypothetical protein LCGC14_1760170 [marine sediment metagenome]|uniref:Toprim domain-containing protein n=1 Tax=marine sediment metagenome TaxID=412755 RepID=A0A0F9H1B1_9ZZZZ
MRRKFVGLLDYLDKRLGSHMGSGPEHQYYCPFCIDRMGDESSERKLWVNVQKGKAVCYRCHFGAGNLEILFRAMNGGVLRIEELVLIKGERQPPAQSVSSTILELFYASEDEVEEPKSMPLPSEHESLLEVYDDPPLRLRRGVNYLKSRGIPARLVDRFSIGYCPTGEFAGYLIFPVIQAEEQVYFTSRFAGKVGKYDRKTKNPKNRDGYHRRQTCLLNYDRVIGSKVVGIVEGPFDMTAHESAVALIGTYLSPVQRALLEVLVEFGTEEFVISLDRDAGRHADVIYTALVGCAPKVTVLMLDHGDPDENRDALPELMKDRRSPSVRDRVSLRLSGDARKRRKKPLDQRDQRGQNALRSQRGSGS